MRWLVAIRSSRIQSFRAGASTYESVASLLHFPIIAHALDRGLLVEYLPGPENADNRPHHVTSFQLPVSALSELSKKFRAQSAIKALVRLPPGLAPDLSPPLYEFLSDAEMEAVTNVIKEAAEVRKPFLIVRQEFQMTRGANLPGQEDDCKTLTELAEAAALVRKTLRPDSSGRQVYQPPEGRSGKAPSRPSSTSRRPQSARGRPGSALRRMLDESPYGPKAPPAAATTGSETARW